MSSVDPKRAQRGGNGAALQALGARGPGLAGASVAWLLDAVAARPYGM